MAVWLLAGIVVATTVCGVFVDIPLWVWIVEAAVLGILGVLTVIGRLRGPSTW